MSAFFFGGDIIDNSKRTKTEIYSRVCGYLSPKSQFNHGKKEEFKDRKNYDKTLRDLAKS